MTQAVNGKARLRVTLDILADLNGVQLTHFKESLESNVNSAIGNGMITGHSEVEVDQRVLTVLEVPEALTEEQITAFMRQQIQDGNMSIEDLAARLARYGLMESPEFLAEMHERMDPEMSQ